MSTETIPQAIAEQAETGRKFTDLQVTGELAGYALTWLTNYEGTFEFLVELKAKLDQKGSLSVGQTRGVLNCILAEQKRASRVEVTTDVPEGYYAVTSATGNNDLDFYRVDRPTEGKWKDKVFVKRVIGGHPDTSLRYAEIPAVLDRITAAGVDEAAVLYGTSIGQCYKCNRHLTDELSRQLGIGPTCREKGI